MARGVASLSTMQPFWKRWIQPFGSCSTSASGYCRGPFSRPLSRHIPQR